MTLSDYQGEEAAFTQYDERKYSTLQSHHFRNGTDYDNIKHIHKNITRLVSHLYIILSSKQHSICKVKAEIWSKAIMKCAHLNELVKTLCICKKIINHNMAVSVLALLIMKIKLFD